MLTIFKIPNDSNHPSLQRGDLQQRKDSVRQQRARELLLRTSRPIKQIAAEVGFHNEKSFMRAFKGWTGRTPQEFRLTKAV